MTRWQRLMQSWVGAVGTFVLGALGFYAVMTFMVPAEKSRPRQEPAAVAAPASSDAGIPQAERNALNHGIQAKLLAEKCGRLAYNAPLATVVLFSMGVDPAAYPWRPYVEHRRREVEITVSGLTRNEACERADALYGVGGRNVKNLVQRLW